jgi:hypothetical protein
MIDPEAFNYYDAFDINDQFRSSLRLFGNTNIGNAHLTNIQVPGILGGDNILILQRWWARTNVGINPISETRTGAAALMTQLAHSMQLIVEVGQRYTWRRSLAELYDRRPRLTPDNHYEAHRCDPLPMIIKPRTNVQVRIDGFDPELFDELARIVRREGPNGLNTESRTPLVWIHLEGIEIPSGHRFAFGHDGEKLADRIMSVHREHRSAEERIADWILGRMHDAAPEEMQYLSVVRDAILEGKHRG